MIKTWNNLDFPIIQSELDHYDNILAQGKLLLDLDFEQFFFAKTGIALIQAQRIEFVMLGIIANIDEQLLKKDKNFKTLIQKDFYRLILKIIYIESKL